MKLFLSYSGSSSKTVAKALKDWIPLMFDEVEPFVAEDHVQKGALWFDSLQAALESSHCGIICLTPDNLSSPWLLFEAGALCSRLGPGKVWPILFGVEVSAVKSPLAHFQCVVFNQDGIEGVMRSLRANLPGGEQSRSDADFKVRFDRKWRYLDKDVEGAMLEISRTASVLKSPEGSQGRGLSESATESAHVSLFTPAWPPLFREALRKLFKLRDAVIRIGTSHPSFATDYREETKSLGIERNRNIQASVVDGFGDLRYHDQVERIGERATIPGHDGLDRFADIMRQSHGAVFWLDRGSNLGLPDGFARSNVALFTTCGETRHRVVVETHEECSISDGHFGESWITWKQRQLAPAVASIDAAVRALMTIRLECVESVSFRTTIGGTLKLLFTIDNPSPLHIEAWLGAQLDHPGGSFWDVSEDKTVTLVPGRHQYSRNLTVRHDVSPGRTVLTGGLWVGKCSDSKTAIRLAVQSTLLELTRD